MEEEEEVRLLTTDEEKAMAKSIKKRLWQTIKLQLVRIGFDYSNYRDAGCPLEEPKSEANERLDNKGG